MSHHAPIRSAFITGGQGGHGVLKEKYLKKQVVDILIATPGKLLKLRDSGKVFLGNVKYVAVDEADVLTNPSDGFLGPMNNLFSAMMKKRRGESPHIFFRGRLYSRASATTR